MDLARGLLVIGLVAAVAQAERKGVLQAMGARPIVLGPILGWLLGDAQAGLMIGAPLELLWLGAINIGATLPDHEVVGLCAVVGGAALATGGEPVSPDVAILAFVLLAPVAILGRWVDEVIERHNVSIADRAAAALAAGRDSPAAVNVIGLLAPSVAAAGLAVFGAALGALLLPRILDTLPAAAQEALAGAWLAIGALGGAAAVAGIRVRRAHVLAGAGAAAALLVVLVAVLVRGGTP